MKEADGVPARGDKMGQEEWDGAKLEQRALERVPKTRSKWGGVREIKLRILLVLALSILILCAIPVLAGVIMWVSGRAPFHDIFKLDKLILVIVLGPLLTLLFKILERL